MSLPFKKCIDENNTPIEMEIISGRNSSNLDYRNSKLSNIGRDNINIEQSKDEYAYQYQIIIFYSNKCSESRIELKVIVLLMP